MSRAPGASRQDRPHPCGFGHQKKPVQGDRLIRQLAASVDLEISTVGSQLRAHFHGPSARAFDRIPRREHAIVCRRRVAR
jgi:hypothetical protein